VRIRFEDEDLPARAFEKDGNVTQKDVEDNKHLGQVLEVIRKQQLEHSKQQLTSRNRSLREKQRIRDSLRQRT
jgi:hypothetical protein